MRTETIFVDAVNPDPVIVARAAALLRTGGLVAFPTETVYGLGANARDAAAVARIFEAKGRPAANPVIVHVAEPEQALTVASAWPEQAAKLAAHFWPGPLTIVVPRSPELPKIITAGGATLGIRCPAHPVARALIAAAGVPIAAPSANRSTELSPTRAEHVLHSLEGRIEMVLDGGPCPGGLESTVVDATGEIVRLLRPGLITVPMLEAVVGPLMSNPIANAHEPVRSPGQMAKHYSPRTPVRLVDGTDLAEALLSARHSGLRFVCVTFHRSENEDDADYTSGQFVNLPANASQAAAELYDTLFRLDSLGLHFILIEVPPKTPEWAAVRDRLQRAAST